jgi:hypothetical protein
MDPRRNSLELRPLNPPQADCRFESYLRSHSFPVTCKRTSLSSFSTVPDFVPCGCKMLRDIVERYLETVEVRSSSLLVPTILPRCSCGLRDLRLSYCSADRMLTPDLLLIQRCRSPAVSWLAGAGIKN